MAIVVPKAQQLTQLSDIIAARLDGGSLRLFQNNYVPDSSSNAASFTVANFTGYANKTIATWGAPFLDGTNVPSTLAPLQTFTATASTVTNIVYGVYYLDAGGELVFAERFATPMSFNAADVALPMVPRFQLGNIAAAA